MIRLCREHSLYSWSRQDSVEPLAVVGGEGAWFWTADGKRLLDFNSQTMSVTVGHGERRVIDAMKAQLDALPYAYPGAATEIRARAGQLLASVLPGDLDVFFFTLGGSDANESAIKAARWATGRHKILSRYRSYHGATAGAMQLTGDPRRWATEPGPPGFIHVLDPEPYGYSFGATAAERTARHLAYLEEVIRMEGPDQIAALFIETVTGTNGVLAPPDGWLRGVRELTERHGILLVCDEVMCGFGRTGRWFAFEHEGITPDIVTMAKGLTSSYAPLGAMALRRGLARRFDERVFQTGLTYHAHPVSLAAAVANVEVLQQDGLVARAAALEPVVREEIDRLAAAHPSVRGGRAIGLFAMIDLQRDASGQPFGGFNAKHPLMHDLYVRLLEEGLFAYVRWSTLMVLPPLCIDEADLREGFARVGRALDVMDAAFEG
ncbi:MAG: aminotransferase class III-fold pyridoxal phosphate-dependent enzyme [Deltaproteobacteria bacterium]|nr:aminotransferase class III-fold pyridoxal phosphate-dependent enzyme [Deltaproteobacteria bacterium]